MKMSFQSDRQLKEMLLNGVDGPNFKTPKSFCELKNCNYMFFNRFFYRRVGVRNRKLWLNAGNLTWCRAEW